MFWMCVLLLWTCHSFYPCNMDLHSFCITLCGFLNQWEKRKCKGQGSSGTNVCRSSRVGAGRTNHRSPTITTRNESAGIQGELNWHLGKGREKSTGRWERNSKQHSQRTQKAALVPLPLLWVRNASSLSILQFRLLLVWTSVIFWGSTSIF